MLPSFQGLSTRAAGYASSDNQHTCLPFLLLETIFKSPYRYFHSIIKKQKPEGDGLSRSENVQKNKRK